MFWTFQPKIEQSRHRHLPFITWPVQDYIIEDLVYRIRHGGDLLIDKSREMGATWIVLGSFFNEWLLSPDTTLMVISRKEEYVWKGHRNMKGGDKNTLFWKLFYLYHNLPLWVQPVANSSERHFENVHNGSTIDGESTNPNVGAGGRCQAIMCDELSRAKGSDAEGIIDAISDTTPCRIFNSTPTTRGHPFGQLRFSGRIDVSQMPWWEHPWKIRGHYSSPDINFIVIHDIGYYRQRWPEIFNKIEPGERLNYSDLQTTILTTTTKNEKCHGKEYGLRELIFVADGNDPANEEMYSPTGRRSPWYDFESARRSRRDKATNIDMMYEGAGDVIFSPSVMLRMVDQVCREPYITGEVDYHVEDNKIKGVRFVQQGHRRRLKWWQPLCGARPDQAHNYIIGCDVSLGTGQSNSVASIFDVNLNMKVGRWSCSNTSPTHFAEQVCALGKWIGGVSEMPYLIWEANGVGQIFDRRLYQIGYDFVYYRREEKIPTRKKRKARGWHSTNEEKLSLLGEYDSAMEANFRPGVEVMAYINPDLQGIRECEDYIFYENGQIGPSSCEGDSGGAKATHGDIVIADALTNLARKDQQRAMLEFFPNLGKGTFLDRRKAYRARIEEQKRTSKWLI